MASDRALPEPTTANKNGIAAAVATFHATFGLPRNDEPTADIPAELAALRVRLLAEEVDEFATATGR
jgi:predicted HAD superfamily Cof-like phosphohydrolase